MMGIPDARTSCIFPKMTGRPDFTLGELRDELSAKTPPVVVFNKSHSGSRLLGTLIEAAGVFMGAHQNDSKDSLDVLPLVEHLVINHYPDYAPLWQGSGEGDAALPQIARTAFERHLEGFAGKSALWGWKLCETTYILPVVDFLFPRAKYIHLIRDGRDVAFSEHRAPNRPFWKKVYFNTDRISAWRGLRFHRRDYAQRSHIYNALHWVNSVSVGRAYGAMLRERCLEVRYEALCKDFEKTARQVLSFLDVDEVTATEAIVRVQPQAHRAAVHKHLRQPQTKVREVVEIEKPLLLSLGYLEPDNLLDIVVARLQDARSVPADQNF